MKGLKHRRKAHERLKTQEKSFRTVQNAKVQVQNAGEKHMKGSKRTLKGQNAEDKHMKGSKHT
jgi:hypothetical protein